jgi:hypothetical protein
MRASLASIAPALATSLALGALLAGCPGSSLSDLGGPCSGTGRGAAAGCRAGLSCDFGRCRERCDISRDCDAGRRCLVGEADGVCSLPAEDMCRAETDCGGGLSCDRGECRTACADDTECGTGGTCSGGTCAEPVSMATPDGTACTSDETCGGSSVCAAGRCRPSCAAGCLRGSRCLSDMGVLGCSLPDEDECSGPEDCPDALSCAGGECRTTCTSTSECGPGGRCDTATSTCDEPESTGRADAGQTVRIDANLGEIDGGAVFVDGGPRGAQTRLAQAFTLSPLPSQTVRVLPAYVSPPFAGRDIIGGSMIAPIGVSLAGRPDADLRGVGYVGAVDGTGAARLFRFPGDDPSAATDRSADLAAATNLVDLALAEDGTQIRGLLVRERTADTPALQAGWTWAEGSAPSAYDRTYVTGLGVYTFGQAAIAGGERSVGADQDLRFLLRERERLPVGTDPETYRPGAAYLSTLDVSRNQVARDATASIFTGDVIQIRALPDFALVWDPDTRAVVMMRLREEGGILRTGYERLGFVGSSDAPPAIAQQSLLRTEAVIAVPNGPSTTLHRISCPEASDCAPSMGTTEVFLPTPGGTTATAIAIAPLLGGYALVTADSEGIVVRALSRELEEIPGYDDGMRLEPLGGSTITDGGSFNLLDLDAYTVRQDDGTDLHAVTLYVAGLFYNFTSRQARVWVRGVRVEVP